MATLTPTQPNFQTRGGRYIIATHLNGGTAALNLYLSGNDTPFPLGMLTATPQVVEVPPGSRLQAALTGDAVVTVQAINA